MNIAKVSDGSAVTPRPALATLVLSLTCGLVAAHAQNYPTQNLKFVVPFAAGSATDTLARLLGARMAASLGRSISETAKWAKIVPDAKIEPE